MTRSQIMLASSRHLPPIHRGAAGANLFSGAFSGWLRCGQGEAARSPIPTRSLDQECRVTGWALGQGSSVRARCLSGRQTLPSEPGSGRVAPRGLLTPLVATPSGVHARSHGEPPGSARPPTSGWSEPTRPGAWPDRNPVPTAVGASSRPRRRATPRGRREDPAGWPRRQRRNPRDHGPWRER